MKASTLRTYLLCLFVFGGLQLSAQESKSKSPSKTSEEIQVEKRTLMERFEPKMVVSVEQRIQMKKDRKAEMARALEMLDTMDIKARKRQRLLKDLHKNSFTSKLYRAMVEAQYSDQDE
ncbi:hypothetical protein [Spongiimicrobium sp. 2-473A-2-J]|uniref:hypothetical protein n=1 Tax=Eudoraea algarum TaxID=3417568 RepID=UPI003D35A98A